MTQKTLYLHAGGSKTGTSAIQVFLEINSLNLETAGFAYKNLTGIKSEYEISIGNGLLLYNALVSAKTHVQLCELIMSYFSNENNAIISSEFFQHLTIQQLKRLVKTTSRMGIKLDVIFYVRNIAPFFQSAYDQLIKRHGEYRAIDEWVQEVKSADHINFLKSVTTVIPMSDIHVIHYDTARTDIIDKMLEVLGIQNSSDIIYKQQRSKVVNRSLTQEERELLTFANKILGARYSQEISDMLIYQSPNVISKPASLSKTSIDELINTFQDDVNWVNINFFDNADVLKINEFDKKEIKNSISKNYQHRVNETVLNWALNKIQMGRKESEEFMLNQLINIGMNCSLENNPNVPSDFNPVNYLILNIDVLYAQADPVQHWIDHGASEGRIYKVDKGS